ncbi:MAG: HipA family kinase [Veillonellales bacterium]
MRKARVSIPYRVFLVLAVEGEDSMLTAVEYLKNVGVGVTTPQFFRGNDGNVYVVKMQHNRLGTKVLASELLAAKIGELLGLCFPPGGIIQITEDLLQKNSCLPEAGAKPGIHFASKYLNNCRYVEKHNLNQVINISDMAGIILFDHMFHNKDRTYNRKNLLLRQEPAGYKLYAIDNSHLFRSGNWTIESLARLRSSCNVYYGYFFSLLLKKYLTPLDFRPYREKVSRLRDEQIEGLVGEIPEEWLSNEAERQALTNYIKIRRDMVEKIREELCNRIPRSRGGHKWLRGRVFSLKAETKK